MCGSALFSRCSSIHEANEIRVARHSASRAKKSHHSPIALRSHLAEYFREKVPSVPRTPSRNLDECVLSFEVVIPTSETPLRILLKVGKAYGEYFLHNTSENLER